MLAIVEADVNDVCRLSHSTALVLVMAEILSLVIRAVDKTAKPMDLTTRMDMNDCKRS